MYQWPPGLSDHDIVLAQVNAKPKITMQIQILKDYYRFTNLSHPGTV